MGTTQSTTRAHRTTRQDSLLGLEQTREQKRRGRVFSQADIRELSKHNFSANDCLDEDGEQSCPPPCPLLPTSHIRKPEPTSTHHIPASNSRRRSLPAPPNRRPHPSTLPPITTAPVIDPDAPGIKMTRYFTSYPRCCSNTWLTGAHFVSDDNGSTQSSMGDVVIHESEDICLRCLRRVQNCSFYLAKDLGFVL